MADINHLQELVTYEQNCDLKMAFGLKQEDVNFEKSSSNFEKMKVKNSTKYVNHGVAAALRVYAEETGREDVLTTAFLIDTIATWFKLMTSRSIQLSFSRMNEDVYTSSIDSLLKFRSIIFDCKVGAKGQSKPWQSAAVMATDSVLRLQEFFLKHEGFDFFLGGRLTQDSLENIFSQLRSRQMRPNALQLKDSLKLLTVSQYLNSVEQSSYEWEDNSWLLEFPSYLEAKATKTKVVSNRTDQDIMPTNQHVIHVSAVV